MEIQVFLICPGVHFIKSFATTLHAWGKMNVSFNIIEEIYAAVEACKHGLHQFRARRKPKLCYEIEICPGHQILAWRGVYAGMKPFMKWTPAS